MELPEHFDYVGGSIGPITSNSMGRGNRRMIYAFKLLLKRIHAAAGRTILAMIKDSVLTMKKEHDKPGSKAWSIHLC